MNDGTTASTRVRARKANRSATKAHTHDPRAAPRTNPRVTLAGATTSLNRPHASRMSSDAARQVSGPGMSETWLSITQVTNSTRPRAETPKVVNGSMPRRRQSMARPWLTSTASSTTGRNEPSANRRPMPTAAASDMPIRPTSAGQPGTVGPGAS